MYMVCQTLVYQKPPIHHHHLHHHHKDQIADMSWQDHANEESTTTAAPHLDPVEMSTTTIPSPITLPPPPPEIPPMHHIMIRGEASVWIPDL
jgi:hypothetical protein